MSHHNQLNRLPTINENAEFNFDFAGMANGTALANNLSGANNNNAAGMSYNATNNNVGNCFVNGSMGTNNNAASMSNYNPTNIYVGQFVNGSIGNNNNAASMSNYNATNNNVGHFVNGSMGTSNNGASASHHLNNGQDVPVDISSSGTNNNVGNNGNVGINNNNNNLGNNDTVGNNTSDNVNNNGVGNNNVASRDSSGDVSMDLEWNSEYPPGYRFCPRDEELICFYLERKIKGLVLPHDKIKDTNLAIYNPDQLCEMYEPVGDDEWYFFTPRARKYRNGDRPNRAAGTGYWKATGADKPINHPYNSKQVIGQKKTLVFYNGKPPKGIKTNYIQHEYKVNNPTPIPKKERSPTDMKLDDWVLCKIYNKVDNPRANNGIRIGGGGRLDTTDCQATAAQPAEPQTAVEDLIFNSEPAEPQMEVEDLIFDIVMDGEDYTIFFNDSDSNDNKMDFICPPLLDIDNNQGTLGSIVPPWPQPTPSVADNSRPQPTPSFTDNARPQPTLCFGGNSCPQPIPSVTDNSRPQPTHCFAGNSRPQPTPSFADNSWPQPTPSFANNSFPQSTSSFADNSWRQPTPSFADNSGPQPTPSFVGNNFQVMPMMSDIDSYNNYTQRVLHSNQEVNTRRLLMDSMPQIKGETSSFQPTPTQQASGKKQNDNDDDGTSFLNFDNMEEDSVPSSKQD